MGADRSSRLLTMWDGFGCPPWNAAGGVDTGSATGRKWQASEALSVCRRIAPITGTERLSLLAGRDILSHRI